MRVLNVDTGEAIAKVCLYLTASEAHELIGALQDVSIQKDETRMEHSHVNDDEYVREITVAVYTEKNLHEFDDRSRKLIIEGE